MHNGRLDRALLLTILAVERRSTRIGAVPVRIEPLKQFGTRAAIDNALPDPGETVRVGNVAKMTRQRVAGRDAELAGRLSTQQFTLRRKAPLKPFLEAFPRICQNS